jgi:glucose-1-phosphate thymidylyltransferase
VAELDGDRIVGIEEKPARPKSPYAVTGIYLFDGTVFEKVRSLVPSRRGELEITDVNNAYLRDGALRATFLGDEVYWTDAGTFESLHRANGIVAKERGTR